MLLHKEIPEEFLKFNIKYENENTRLLIRDVIKNHNARITVFNDTEISEGIALLILETINRCSP